ncbi:MAG: Na+/H+ antiporter subunit E [Bacillota bacterium]
MALIRHPFLWLLFAVLWMVLQDAYTYDYFFAGLLTGALVFLLFPAPEVRVIRFAIRGPADFFPWLFRSARLVIYFLWELLQSNYAVGRMVLTPKLRLTPGILAMPLQVRQPGQIALLANLITLTPGTISMGVSKDNSVLYIHCIDVSDPEGALASSRRFEELIMGVLK